MSNPPLLGLRTVCYAVPDLASARDWYATFTGVAPYFDQPFYVGFHGLLQFYGEPELTRRVSGILSRCGVFRVATRLGLLPSGTNVVRAHDILEEALQPHAPVPGR